MEEIEYHPLTYKTRECSENSNYSRCNKETTLCPYSHGDLRRKNDPA